jgi:acyl transferase domain-containing protein/NADPH:quinone reductase-like Zn-dependent oxidoreductase/NAD(P)-dependent dehydrogenase (short-subunit alcohol dehydrogenase family)/acyl carrier protein
MREKTKYKGSPPKEPIAIIGMGCRFPGGANSPEKFWRNILNGTDAIVDVPSDRWDMRMFYDQEKNKEGKIYAKQGGFLQESIYDFDPLFFGITPNEAESIDPQQRLLLETTWEAFENAGIVKDQITGSSTGVFVGGFTIDNGLLQLDKSNLGEINSFTASNASLCILSNRISHVFDLKGPSMTIDTACSSSVVATHVAVQSLRSGDCNLALVGGVNVMLMPSYFVTLCKAQFLSDHSRCKAFDRDARGYARAEGAGMLVLKPLSSAIEDGDNIHALIVETGINQDGKTAGISQPNPEAQEALIREVYRKANITGDDISYIEAHGTGTIAGDTAEIKAINNVLSEARNRLDKCPVGSVKSNIGHLEAGAGVAAIIKTALSLQHRIIPPNIHFNEPNPEIVFHETSVFIPVEPRLLSNKVNHYAGINSFGYGGTNGHILLSTFQDGKKEVIEKKSNIKEIPLMLPFSAANEKALLELTKQYYDLLQKDPFLSLHDLAYSLCKKRTHHQYRLSLVVSSTEELINKLKKISEGSFESTPLINKADEYSHPPLVFVLSGMGPQWWKMGHELIEKEPVFKETVIECDRVFRDIAGWSIMDEILKGEKESRIGMTQIAHPANFVIQVALARLWNHWGVKPDCVVGHSSGEAAAAYISGALSLEDAIRVIYHRSRLLQKCANQGGAMLAVGANAQDCLSLIKKDSQVSIAAINSRKSTILSGDESALRKAANQFEKQGIFNRFLNVEVAYHSSHVDSIKESLINSLSPVSPQDTEIPFYSTVTGTMMEGKQLDAEYWWNNTRQPVLFARAVEVILDKKDSHFLEIGPHPVLKYSLNDILLNVKKTSKFFESLNMKTSEGLNMIENLGKLYTHGFEINWDARLPGDCRFIPLPNYPWQHERYWKESRISREQRVGKKGSLYFKVPMDIPFPSWQTDLNQYFFPFVNDHKIDDIVILPGASYIDIGLSIHAELFKEKACTLENIRFKNVLPLNSKDTKVIHSGYNPHTQEYLIHSKNKFDEDGEWTLHARGEITGTIIADEPVIFDPSHAEERCKKAVAIDELYLFLDKLGYCYGNSFRIVKNIWYGDDEALIDIEIDKSVRNIEEEHVLHPTLIDGCFQPLIPIMLKDREQVPYVPVGIERFDFFGRSVSKCSCHGVITKRTSNAVYGNITLFDKEGKVIAKLIGLECRPMRKEERDFSSIEKFLYGIEWGSAEPTEIHQELLEEKVLLFHENDNVSRELIKRLKEKNVHHIEVRAGESYFECNKTQFTLRRGEPEDLFRFFKQIKDLSYTKIIYLWSLKNNAQGDSYDQYALHHCMPLTTIIQALHRNQGAEKYSIVTATRGCQPVAIKTNKLNLEAASVTSLGQVIKNEYENIECAMVDLDFRPEKDDAEILFTETFSITPEKEVAYRNKTRLYKKIVKLDVRKKHFKERLISTDAPLELYKGKQKDQNEILFQEIERKKAGEGELEVRVHAFSLDLNSEKSIASKDTSYSREPARKGITGKICSGTIVSIGKGGKKWKVGEEVIILSHNGNLGTYAMVKSESVIRKPPFITHNESVVIKEYLTAYKGIIKDARLKQGEWVFIHCDSDILRHALVSLALWKKAKIITTVESEDKANYLKSMGAHHILMNQPGSYIHKVEEIREGLGVDVIMHSIKEEKPYTHISLLAPFGRYLEITTGNIQENCFVNFKHLRFNKSVITVDLESNLLERPEECGAFINEFWDIYHKGILPPPSLTAFKAENITDAINFSQRNQSIGATVLSFADSKVNTFNGNIRKKMKKNGTYLISGGTRGFGLEIAKNISLLGIQKLILVSRNGLVTEEAKQSIKEIEKNGTIVTVKKIDVSKEEQVMSIKDVLKNDNLPLRGIIHCAMVLDDWPIIDLNKEKYEKVFLPKIMGAWNLHKLTMNLDTDKLDHFIMLSSIASILGNKRQANYIAANTFLDNFAYYRQSMGLPGTTINLNALSDTGIISRYPVINDYMQRIGIIAFDTKTAIKSFEYALVTEYQQIAPCDINWDKWFIAGNNENNFIKFKEVLENYQKGIKKKKKQKRFHKDMRNDEVELILSEILEGFLHIPGNELDKNKRINDYGVDSLMMVEIANAISREFGVEVNFIELLGGLSVSRLSKRLLDIQLT